MFLCFFLKNLHTLVFIMQLTKWPQNICFSIFVIHLKPCHPRSKLNMVNLKSEWTVRNYLLFILFSVSKVILVESLLPLGPTSFVPGPVVGIYLQYCDKYFPVLKYLWIKLEARNHFVSPYPYTVASRTRSSWKQQSNIICNFVKCLIFQ